MKYIKSPNYKSTRGKTRRSGGVAFPALANPVQVSESDQLKAKIRREIEFIEKYPSYIDMCKQALSRITYYQRRLIELDSAFDPRLVRRAGLVVALIDLRTPDSARAALEQELGEIEHDLVSNESES